MPRPGSGWLYRATWPGHCSRQGDGGGVRAALPEGLVSEALRRAPAGRQPTAGLVVHPDQGSQYSSTNFKTLLARHGALQSMSRRGNCYDDARAGSFWSRLKTELLDGGNFPGLTEARLEINHYIAYCNTERRHSALGDHSPNRFETLLQTTSQFCPTQLDHLSLLAPTFHQRVTSGSSGKTSRQA